MSDSSTAGPRPAEPGAAAEDTTIGPFRVEVPDQALDDLRRRIAATRWPSRELVTDRSQGVQLATTQALARYWAGGYDLRRVAARLNALPQFVTTIDGVEIHFLHVRSPHEDALPLIMTHGWPGSVIELIDSVGPLSDPTRPGRSRSSSPQRCEPHWRHCVSRSKHSRQGGERNGTHGNPR